VVISVQNGLEALEKIRTVCQQGSDGSSQDASSHRVSPALVQAVTYVGAKVLSDITPGTCARADIVLELIVDIP
jgi:hypothetical protein